MAERPKSLTVELSKETIRWLHKHPQELACIEQFVALMLEELHANDGKGNRPGWLTMNRKDALAEVHWHASKLAVAAKTASTPAASAQAERDTREYAADVANCALMVLDCMGLLLPGAPR